MRASAVAALSALLLLRCGTGNAAPPQVARLTEVAPVTVSPGVTLRELTGRTATAPGGRTGRGSVAWFRLEPGRASAWSRNRVGEETFLVLAGHGAVWTGSRRQPVGPGSFVLVPPQVVRSVRADAGEALTFYAVTMPAWSREDDLAVAAPAGAPIGP